MRALEEEFRTNPYPKHATKVDLALSLNLTAHQIDVSFCECMFLVCCSMQLACTQVSIKTHMCIDIKLEWRLIITNFGGGGGKSIFIFIREIYI